MRLARRALYAALTALILGAAMAAQAVGPSNAIRRQASVANADDPRDGPTGLFIIYDGDTIRKGEYTFSVAYSNYDRDPGDVNTTVTPLSFNIGLSDHLELFYSTEDYQGVKVNNPKNLSSFYLPNSQLFFDSSLLGSGPSITIKPEEARGLTGIDSAVFLTAYNLTHVRLPFIGRASPEGGPTELFTRNGGDALRKGTLIFGIPLGGTDEIGTTTSESSKSNSSDGGRSGAFCLSRVCGSLPHVSNDHLRHLGRNGRAEALGGKGHFNGGRRLTTTGKILVSEEV